jgi:hypothetical protein
LNANDLLRVTIAMANNVETLLTLSSGADTLGVGVTQQLAEESNAVFFELRFVRRRPYLRCSISDHVGLMGPRCRLPAVMSQLKIAVSAMHASHAFGKQKGWPQRNMVFASADSV